MVHSGVSSRPSAPVSATAAVDWRRACVDSELRAHHKIDEIGKTCMELTHCIHTTQALVPLRGKWAIGLGRSTMARIVSFLREPPFPPWKSYPTLIGADNDPVLPHHCGHWMQPSLRLQHQGLFLADHWEDSLRLQIRHFTLSATERELQQTLDILQTKLDLRRSQLSLVECYLRL